MSFALKRHSVMRLEISALLVDVVAFMVARSFEVVVPELAATLVDVFVEDEGDVALLAELEVSSLATVVEVAAVLPLVSLAFELSVEFDFVVSLAATVAVVSDFV